MSQLVGDLHLLASETKRISDLADPKVGERKCSQMNALPETSKGVQKTTFRGKCIHQSWAMIKPFDPHMRRDVSPVLFLMGLSQLQTT
jgi:hypothetical protein